MNRRLLLGLTAIEITLVFVAIYCEPTCLVRGHVHGEATYAGKPTSWWRRELEMWSVSRVQLGDPLGCASMRQWSFVAYTRESSWFETQRARWWPVPQDDARLSRALDTLNGPAILRDPEGKSVLEELREDPSPNVRRIAHIGLGLDAEIPEEK